MRQHLLDHKNIYFCCIDYAKAFDCVDHNKLWKIFKGMEILDHVTCLLRNLYAGQEATVRIRLGTKSGKEYDFILSSCLLNFCAECIMQNAILDKAQAGIKIAGRNINNLRYADDTTVITESEEKLKNPLMRVKEESEKTGLHSTLKKKKKKEKQRLWQLVPPLHGK